MYRIPQKALNLKYMYQLNKILHNRINRITFIYFQNNFIFPYLIKIIDIYMDL